MTGWLAGNPAGEWSAAEWVGAVALLVGTTVATLLIAGVVLVRLPADHFVAGRPPGETSWPARALRNLVGVGLILVGAVLSIPGVPGQGLLTVLAGVLLVDLPGKRRAERWLVRRRGIRAAINRLRARCGRPPFEFGPPGR